MRLMDPNISDLVLDPDVHYNHTHTSTPTPPHPLPHHTLPHAYHTYTTLLSLTMYKCTEHNFEGSFHDPSGFPWLRIPFSICQVFLVGPKWVMCSKWFCHGSEIFCQWDRCS